MRNAAHGALLLAICLAAPATAGVVEGTLHVPASVPAPARLNPYPGRAGSLADAARVVRGLATDAVVYVDRVPAPAESALAARRGPPARLAQQRQAFVPRVLAVAAGARVDFPNLDPIYHNVFSLSPIQRFDLGKYPKGSSRQVVFRKPGLATVYCDIHSDMEGFVYVLPHHGFARPAADGRFALPPLPAGRYVLTAWHPDLGERRADVTVPETGSVTADLSYR